YPKVPIGRLTLDVVRVGLGGDGRTRYSYPDGIECISRRTDYEVPPDVRQVTKDWLSREIEINREQNIPFEDRPQPRLHSAGPGLTDEKTEQLWPLKLTISRTNYFATQVTHRCLGFLLPNGRSIREVYGGSVDDLTSSKLANPLAINLSVITKDNHIY